jgi:UDP-N-acetylglucosamine--N-acetylmuramyl-(pentapeptide) pyrophosphoryl-undecaprenol N-acetylglucosamine transferase
VVRADSQRLPRHDHHGGVRADFQWLLSHDRQGVVRADIEEHRYFMGLCFVMAGGGTGGHVIPALAVARELRERGHRPVFVGTRTGIEARLVPGQGFPFEFIEIGGLMKVGFVKAVRTLAQLPVSVVRSIALLKRLRPAAVFGSGGYVAGPVMLAAAVARVPFVLLEPDAMPGFTNRKVGRLAARALIGFPEAARHFPKGRTELVGLPVRQEFFDIPPKHSGSPLTILVTGGSRGSRRLNHAARAAWSLFRERGLAVRWIHQSGKDDYEELSREFAAQKFDGTIAPFLDDMPAAFTEADLIVCRSGAGAVAELAAAGKPSILVPFPFAAHQHQLRNAESFAAAGAARLVLDGEMTGERLYGETRALVDSGALRPMGDAAKRLARPRAAVRAAEILEEIARPAAERAGEALQGS